jgi:hypothetical protein
VPKVGLCQQHQGDWVKEKEQQRKIRLCPNTDTLNRAIVAVNLAPERRLCLHAL